MRAGAGHLALCEAELRAWGVDLGSSCEAPLVISLSGELGAGKTTLAQSICEGYGVIEAVTSPTYAIIQRYESPRSPVFHIDLYRLDKPSDLTNIGWNDIMSERALVIVEWPERAEDRMPDGHLHIDLQYSEGDPSRRVLLAG